MAMLLAVPLAEAGRQSGETLNIGCTEQRKLLLPDPAMTVSYSDSRLPSREQTIELYRSVEWSSADKPEALMPALAGSHSLVTAWDDDALVGLANAISDGHLVAYFPHLLVHPKFQHSGIGSSLIRMLQP